MNKNITPEPDLDNLLKRTLKDDLPSDAEARMNRQLLRFKRTLDRTERLPEPNEWLWIRGSFRKEILAVASAAMIILGLVMQLSSSQSVLAHSIEQLRVLVTVSAGLKRAAFMDCAVLKPGAGGEQTSYRVQWRSSGDVRIDMDSADGAQTLWISNETISFSGPDGGVVRSLPINTMTPGPVWQPALQVMTPKLLAERMEREYGSMQTRGMSLAGSDEFLLVGQEDGQDIEISIDAKTYLPKALRRYALEPGGTSGGRNCVMEVRFLWNQPISPGLFIPGPLATKR